MDPSRTYALGEVPLAQLSIGLFFLAWIIGGVFTFLASLCYAELVTLLPHSGGPYAYLKAAYPEIVTFLRGWTMFFVSETASIVAVALVFSEYASILWEQTSGIEASWSMHATAALLLIWLFSFANCLGLALSGLLQNILSAIKIFALIVMSGLFLGVDGGDGAFQENFWPSKWGWGTMLALGQAMRYTFFAYSGWEGATYIAEEVRKPRRNLPISLFLGIGFVMILYLLVNAGYVYQLGGERIVIERKGIAAAAMENVLGLVGLFILSAFVMISTAGNVSTQILVKARTWYAMARDGLFFSSFARLSPRSNTPNIALLGQASWASVLLFCSFSFENSYETLIDFFSFTSAFFNLLSFAAVGILRYKMPKTERPFRTPCLKIVLSIVLSIQLWFLLITLYDRPLESLFGLGLAFSGIFYYFYVKKIRKI